MWCREGQGQNKKEETDRGSTWEVEHRTPCWRLRPVAHPVSLWRVYHHAPTLEPLSTERAMERLVWVECRGARGWLWGWLTERSWQSISESKSVWRYCSSRENLWGASVEGQTGFNTMSYCWFPQCFPVVRPFLKDTAGWFSSSLFGRLSSCLLLFCFLLCSVPLKFPLLYLHASLCLLTPIMLLKRKKQKGKLLFQPEPLLSVSIKSRPHWGLQRQASLVVAVCWLSTHIKTCRLWRKIKAPVPHELGVETAFVWDKAPLLRFTGTNRVTWKEVWDPSVAFVSGHHSSARLHHWRFMTKPNLFTLSFFWKSTIENNSRTPTLCRE